MAYQWQAGRQLKRMSAEDKAVSFKYDHNGLRTQKVVEADWYPETTNYYLHGKLLTHMTVDYRDTSEAAHRDVMYFFYDAQCRPAKVSYNGIIYTYIHNLQGDIVGILDSTGSLVAEYKYDAWGKPIATTGSLDDTLGKRNPFRYRGYIYDEEARIYYVRSRYYVPEWNRFLNADCTKILTETVGQQQSGNLYQYCKNACLIAADEDGNWLNLVIGAIAGAVISAGCQIVSNVIQGKDMMSGAARRWGCNGATSILTRIWCISSAISTMSAPRPMTAS